MFFEISLLLGDLALLALFAFLAHKSRSISERLSRIVEGQRLSTILTIEPSEFKIDPSKFEADKKKLLVHVARELHVKRYGSPATQAFVVIHQSGLADFIGRETRRDLETALARLIGNEDLETAEQLLEVAINQL